MRKLASIQRITDIRPIEGKDRIVQCHVNGWNVIIKKDEFTDGDLGVYVEIDSQLPEKPEFEFLRPKKFRIRTMKMSGVLSEGIVFPLTILPAREKPYELDEDVTELMGVTKYEPQEDEAWWKNLEVEGKKTFWAKLPLMRFRWYRRLVGDNKKKGGFPDFIPKSDETRIQNLPWLCKDQSTQWVATEKVDGCSASYVLIRHRRFLLPDKFEFVICSRNCRLAPNGTSHYHKVAEKYDIRHKLEKLIGFEDWVAIQGEIVGPKIQKNKYKLDDYKLYVFNLMYPARKEDNSGRTWRRFSSMAAKPAVEYVGLEHVPIIATNVILPPSVDEVLAMAHGQSVVGDTLREGIVFRSQDGEYSFKAVDPEFLIHYGI